MAYQIEGTYLENCSCDSLCPCTTSNFTAKADKDWCRALVAFHIDRGTIDDVDVSDRSVVLVVDAPGEMLQGGWKVGLIIDADASDAQAEKLQQFCAGEIPSPLAALTPLIGELVGVERLPIRFEVDGGKHTLQAGEAVDIQLEDVVHEGMSEPVKVTNVALPWASEVAISRADSGTVRVFGHEWDHAGQNANAAPISWSG